MEVQGNEFETYVNCEHCQQKETHEFVEIDYVLVSGAYWDISGPCCDHGTDAGVDADEDK